MDLAGRRVLVVGASSGLGRATGLAIAAAGGRVAFAARRKERLEEAVAEAGADCQAVVCDVRDEGSCASAVAESVEVLGGLDAFVYAPGVSSWLPLAELPAQTWRDVFETNVIGATSIAKAAIPHLEATRGKAIFFSSISVDDSPPRSHNAPYVVSKVALEALVRAWQGEHRAVGFTSIAMGDTFTEFGQDADLGRVGAIVQRWVRDGYMYGRAMRPESVAELVVSVLASPETVRRLAITPHYAEDAADPADWGAEAVERHRSESGR